MIEIWLTFNNGAEKLRLPVLPEEYTLATSLGCQRLSVTEVGEALLIGKRNLKEFGIESYFPLKYDDSCQYRPIPRPSKCVEKIGRWRDSGRPLRLLVVAKGFSINEAMAVENFECTTKRGPEDIYYTLDLVEYRFLKKSTPETPETVGAAGAAGSAAELDAARTAERETEGTYTVKPGDTLSAIARRVYGNAALYRKIMEKNGLTDKDILALRVGLELGY